MYEYLIGCIILSIPLFGIFFLRKDLWKPMIWSGVYYTVFLTIVFIVLSYLSWLFSVDPKRLVTPGYWEPKTLFNIGKITHGLAIEDILFQLIAGGIVAGIYEFIFKEKISRFKISRHHISVLWGGVARRFFLCRHNPSKSDVCTHRIRFCWSRYPLVRQTGSHFSFSLGRDIFPYYILHTFYVIQCFLS